MFQGIPQYVSDKECIKRPKFFGDVQFEERRENELRENEKNEEVMRVKEYKA